MISTRVHPHDIGLTETAVRKRRRSKRLAMVMLTIAVVTAALGWPLYGTTIVAALKIEDQPWSWVIIAYGLLLVSSVTLVLGLWYMLLAQVERLAHMVDVVEMEESPEVAAQTTCGACGRLVERGDRHCRHCGAGLGDSQKHS